jgi:LysR family hydrogen peroxide-inducible transcriptional activator
MTLVQLEYIVAVDTWRHFATAAAKCFITQPTLSMQLQKIEAELGVQIFDRSKGPVVPTAEGVEIIQQARVILKEVERLSEVTRDRQGEIVGELRLGSCRRLHRISCRCFSRASWKYPGIRLKVTELTTEILVDRLKKNLLDAGLVVTPLNDPGIFAQPLFYEEFVVYVSPAETMYKKRYVLAEDIDVRHLWLLEEGHCLRSQIMNLCELKSRMQEDNNFHYEAGSIETLKKMVEMQHGITILQARAARPQSSAVEDGPLLQAPAPVRRSVW